MALRARPTEVSTGMKARMVVVVVVPTSAIHHITITGSDAVSVEWDLSGLDLDGQSA